MLKTEDAFIVDNSSEIFVWVGKGATADERKAALSHGQDYVSKQGRPDWTRVTKILEGTEPTTFKSCFTKWQVAAALPGRPSPRPSLPPLPAAPGDDPADPPGPRPTCEGRYPLACRLPATASHPPRHPPTSSQCLSTTAWLVELAALSTLPCASALCVDSGALSRPPHAPHSTLHARRTQRTPRPSPLPPHPSPFTPHPTSPLTPHPSPLTPHLTQSSPLTPHPSPLTSHPTHPSPLTPHPSPLARCAAPRQSHGSRASQPLA